MLLPSSTVNEDVEEDNHKLSQELSKDIIHQALECRSIGQSKRHDQKLIVVVMCIEYGLRNVFFRHPYLKISRANIQF